MEVSTFEDIDLGALWHLQISELRELADRLGIAIPLSKMQAELIHEIHRVVESEMNYCSPSPL